jgi:hypothetical protein
VGVGGGGGVLYLVDRQKTVTEGANYKAVCAVRRCSPPDLETGETEPEKRKKERKTEKQPNVEALV